MRTDAWNIRYVIVVGCFSLFVIYFAKDYVDHVHSDPLTVMCQGTHCHIHGSFIRLDKEYECQLLC